MPNIPPPPDIPRIPDADSPEFQPPAAGQSATAKARRARLGAVPERPPIVVKVPPGMVLVPEEDPAKPVQTAEERARNYLLRARQRTLPRESPVLLLTDAERAEYAAKKAAREAEDRAEREKIAAYNAAEAAARAAAGYAPLGTPLDDLDHNTPEVTPHQRRYLRVQEYLDEVASIEQQKRALEARQLELIDKGRREALATEYAYPLPTTDTSRGGDGLSAEGDDFRVRTGEPESPDAVPVTFSANSIADRSYTSMVATTLTISAPAAERMVHLADPLHRYFPATLRLLAEGRTGYRHTQALVDHGGLVPAECRAEYEEILLPLAEILTPPQFDRKAKAIAATYLEDPLEERHQDALEHRQVSLTPCEDGMADLTLHMDAVGATAIHNRIRRIGRAIFRKEDGRTRTQTEADVAAEIFLTGTTERPGTPTIDQLNHPDSEPGPGITIKRHGVRFYEVPDSDSDSDNDNDDDTAQTAAGTDTPGLGTGVIGTGLGAGIVGKVAIHVPALTLFSFGDEPAYLENYGPISFDTARLIAGNTPGFTRILTDPDSGATLSVGTKQYKVPDSTRTFILYRDRTCRFPGCSVPAGQCDIDHAVEWQHGGETKVSNLAALCRKHHIVKTNTAWDYTMTPAGVLTWVSPSGREEVTFPAHHIPVTDQGDTVSPDVGGNKGPEQTDPVNDINDAWDAATTNDGTTGTDDDGTLPF